MKRNPFLPIIVGKHSNNCFAIKNYNNGAWPTPWSHLSEAVYLDSIGRRNGKTSIGCHYRWWKVPCICSECPAYALISENYILSRIPRY